MNQDQFLYWLKFHSQCLSMCFQPHSYFRQFSSHLGPNQLSGQPYLRGLSYVVLQWSFLEYSEYPPG